MFQGKNISESLQVVVVAVYNPKAMGEPQAVLSQSSIKGARFALIRITAKYLHIIYR